MRAPAAAARLTVSVCSLLVAHEGHARPDDPSSSDIFRFNAGDVVETFATDRFVLHFTRSGTHAVPPLDTDGSGVPDHVEQLGAVYEAVLTHYTEVLGFRAPLDDAASDPEGDARFDVYLVDFARSADGAFRAEFCRADVCGGYLVQENDFAGYGYPSARYANRLLASHELFHAVQAAYSAAQGPTFGEGTAVWASEQFDPSLRDLELFAGAYLERTDRPLDVDITGPVDSFTYGSAIFWQFLGERLGTDIVRALWQACADNPGSDWFDLLEEVIVEAGGESFASTFADFAAATLMTGRRADVARGFADAADLPELVPEARDLPLEEPRFLVFASSYRTLGVNPAGRPAVHAALAGTGLQIEGLRLVLAPYTARSVGELVVGTPSASGLEPSLLEATLAAPADGLVFVQVVNTRQGGSGARPLLCVGDAREVEACLSSLEAPPSEPTPVPGLEPESAPSCGAVGHLGAVSPLPIPISSLILILILILASSLGRRARLYSRAWWA